jgi:hypothetical protein
LSQNTLFYVLLKLVKIFLKGSQAWQYGKDISTLI